MSRPKFIDEIDRLFEQLVRDPWARPHHPPRPRAGETELALAVPVRAGERQDVSVAIEEHRLVVRARHGVGGQASSSAAERIVALPEDADVVGLEAQFEDGTLHVRVRLRARPPR
ncbi:Hsp20/alpha crystallin family protein [bacterium]|nr:Hsp20/alpha crystallin family protein [bacterium]